MDTIPPSADTHIPPGPNFGLVVAIAAALLIILLAAAYLFLHHDARKLLLQPQTPTALILR
jgi:hypothetical protein